jgi:glycosyltransferase involved in cell wall biosynthesis
MESVNEMNSQLRIAFLVSLSSRKAGGYFASCRQLAKFLGAERGTEVRVFAAEDEYSEEDKAAWQPVPVSALPVRGPKIFGYMPDLSKALRNYAPNIVHVHGLWTYVSKGGMEFCREFGVPYVISPRGCLNPPALKRSRLKKWVALAAYEKAHLSGAALMHALSNNEREAIRNFGIAAPIAVVANGIAPAPKNPPPPPAWLAALLEKKKVMLFLGRINPIKGIISLIRAVAILKARSCEPLLSWHFVIAGWDEYGHLSEVRAEIEKLGVAELFTIAGPLYGDEKASVLNRVNAFILPSFNEGLPMAVLEAWSWGLPTLITPECNLDIAFERNAALRIENDPDQLALALAKMFNLPDSDRSAIGKAALDLVKDRFSWDEIAIEMKNLYHWITNPAKTQVPRSVSSLTHI